ncbi:pecanex-like protein 3 [Anser cygnoides]|uniref:pecanex-like protein 3 n=1 Tax=Anser cygnoides TaxID=8845 RepID=UPI0034D34264
MGAQWRQVARQGLWASLTGGCFLDPHLGPFANCFHLYAWLFLLGLPLLLYTALPPGPAALGLYCGLVAAFFGAVKAVNFRLHAAFDRGAEPDPDGDPRGRGGGEGGPPRCSGIRGARRATGMRGGLFGSWGVLGGP